MAAGVVMALAGAVVLGVAGATGGDDDAGPVPEAGSKFREDARRGGGSLLDALAPVFSEAGRREARVVGLPVTRAVAQLFAVGFVGGTATPTVRRRLTGRDWGLVLIGDSNVKSAGQLRALTRGLERAAARADRVPPLYAADPETLGPIGPGSALDAEGDPRAARVAAVRAGRRLKGAGVDLVLAPVADLGVGGGPSEALAYSDDPAVVADLAPAAVDGWTRAGVLAAPGRFPGEGAASQDPLEGPATVGLSLPELMARDVRPFAALAGRAPAIQMSAALYAAWDGVTPATLLPDAVRLLRRRLGFRGAIVSADLIAATAATGEGIGRAAVAALRAGCDVLVVPGGPAEQNAAYRAVLAAVRRGEVPRARLAEAVRRIADLKLTAGVTADPTGDSGRPR